MTRIIRRFIEKSSVFFTDLTYILSPHYRTPQRSRLIVDYCKISTKYALSRWFRFHDEHFLSLHVTTADYPLFYEIFRQIFVRRSYYPESHSKKPFIIDCGGNMGMSVLYFKYLFPDAEVLVFEPSPNILPILKKNIARNKLSNITLIESAVSDTDGEHTFYSRGIGACGDTMHSELLVGSKVDSAETPHIITTKRLSPFITKAVDFLKLDIEGSEGLVIQELLASGSLKRISAMTMEYHYYPQHTQNDLSSLLKNLTEGGHRFEIFLEQINPQNGRGVAAGSGYYCLITTRRTD